MTIDTNGAVHASDTGRFTGVTQHEGEPELLGQPPERIQPKRGMTFTDHRRLDLTWQPGPGQRYVDAPLARMRITRVTSYKVWYTYATDEPGSSGYFWDLRADFDREYGAELDD